MLELIVVIVVLGLLAALAIPTFQANVDEATVRRAQVSIESYAREVQALQAFRRDGQVTVADVTDAVADFTATGTGTATAVGPGVFAEGGWAVLVPDAVVDGVAASAESTAYKQIAVAFGPNEDAPGGPAVTVDGGPVAGLAMASGVPGRSVYARVTALGELRTWAGDGPADPRIPLDPDAGGELTLTATPGDGTITLTWDAVEGAASYTLACWTNTSTEAAPVWTAAGVTDLAAAAEPVENFVLHTCRATADTGATGTATAMPTTTLEDTDPTNPIIDADWQPVQPGTDPTTHDPATSLPVRTITEPAPRPTDPEAVVAAPTATAALWAATSFPSTHGSPPHRLYLTQRAAGGVVQVTDTGAGATVTQFVPAGTFVEPTGIVAGPNPAHAHSPDRAVLDTLYVADRAGNAVYRVDPGTRSVTKVADVTEPMDIAAGFACFDAAGAYASGTCLQVAGSTGLTQVNLTTGVHTPRGGGATTGLVAVAGPRLWAGQGATTARVTATGASDGALAIADLRGGQQIGTTVWAATGTQITSWALDGTPGAAHGTFTRTTDVHNHGNSPNVYVVADDCVQRLDTTTGAFTNLWCGATAPETAPGLEHVGATTASASGGDLVISPPTTQTGDLVVVTAVDMNTSHVAGVVQGAGWAEAGRASVPGIAGLTSTISYKVADGAEGPITVRWSTTSTHQVTVNVFRGDFDPAQPVVMGPGSVGNTAAARSVAAAPGDWGWQMPVLIWRWSGDWQSLYAPGYVPTITGQSGWAKSHTSWHPDLAQGTRAVSGPGDASIEGAWTTSVLIRSADQTPALETHLDGAGSLTMVGQTLATARASSATLTLPAHDVGDLIVLSAWQSGSGRYPTGAAGYARAGRVGGSGLFWRVADGSEATATLNFSASDGYVAHAVVFRGDFDPKLPVVLGSGTGSSLTAPAYTTDRYGWQLPHIGIWPKNTSTVTISVPGYTMVNRWGGDWRSGWLGFNPTSTLGGSAATASCGGCTWTAMAASNYHIRER